jgi:O-acetyl-ADP-ribose deacetylase (regulator of RNase III)
MAASHRTNPLWTFYSSGRTQVRVYFLPEAKVEAEEARDKAKAEMDGLDSVTVHAVVDGKSVPGMAKLLNDRTLERSLRKNFTLYDVDVVAGNAIRLTGPRSEASAARDYLENKARGGAAETRLVILPDRRLWALCAQLRPPAWQPVLDANPGVTVTNAETGLRFSGTHATVAAAEAKWLQVAAGFAATLVERIVELTQAQEAYLQGEGAAILTKMDDAAPSMLKPLRQPSRSGQVWAETLGTAALRSNDQLQLPDAARSSLSTTAAPACQLLASTLATFDAPAWGLSLRVCLADFREVGADAVVNAANPYLDPAGGIAKAIGDAGGPALTAECNACVAKLPGRQLAPGSALITGSGNLGMTAGITAVVHALAPICPSAGPSATDVANLKATMREALRLAAENGTKILAVPALGCMNYKWSADVATRYIVEATVDWAVAQSVAPSLRHVVFCDIDAATAATFARSLRARVHATGAPVQPQPTSAGPTGQRAPIRKPVSLWEWYRHESDEWMKYDYDQTVRLEDWYEKTGGNATSPSPSPVEGCEISGDVNGKVSDSKHGGRYEVARQDKLCEGDGKTYSMRQKNVVSKYERAVRRTPLARGEEDRVPMYKERLAADAESRKVEAGLAQQALPNPAGPVASARLPIFVPDPSAPPSTPVPAPAPAPAPSLWNLVTNRLWDLVAQPSAAPAPASGSVGAGGGAPPSSGVRPGGWPAHGVLLTGLSSTVLEDAESRLTASLIGALKLSEEPVSLAACDGTFSENMAALRAALRRAGADAVEDNVALQTVRVSALGEGGVSRGERELLKWVAQSVAAAREREAENGRVKFPDEWEGGPFDASTTGMRLVPVASGSREYQDVCRRFMFRPDGSAPAFPNAVLKVERVQNPMAYASYDKEKKVIAAKDRNKGNPNELWMKHGTNTTDPVAIISGEVGLDFRYSAIGFFGRATYLAEDAAYSARHFAYKESPTAHKMLLVRVAAGTIFVSQQLDRSLNHPPSGHDSVRGDVAAGESAVMVYNVSQCYPAYLITYTP